MATSTDNIPPVIDSLFKSVLARASADGVFGPCHVSGAKLICEAKGAGDHAEYRLVFDGSQVWVALVTPGRYLSQSIEQTLVFSGDKAGDLLRDELIDLGAVPDRTAATPVVEHFRDNEKLYTFRTPLGITAANAADAANVKKAGDYLLGYAQTFGHLGDMEGDEEEE